MLQWEGSVIFLISGYLRKTTKRRPYILDWVENFCLVNDYVLLTVYLTPYVQWANVEGFNNDL
jgi:hypothetical protein